MTEEASCGDLFWLSCWHWHQALWAAVFWGIATQRAAARRIDSMWRKNTSNSRSNPLKLAFVNNTPPLYRLDARRREKPPFAIVN